MATQTERQVIAIEKLADSMEKFATALDFYVKRWYLDSAPPGEIRRWDGYPPYDFVAPKPQPKAPSVAEPEQMKLVGAEAEEEPEEEEEAEEAEEAEEDV